MQESAVRTEHIVEVDGFAFAGGERMDRLSLSFWTMGTLNDRRDNALLLCHGASGGKDWALPYCRADGAFDPDRYFIVSLDMPGGGASSRRRSDAAFPASYAIGDLATAAIALLDELSIGRFAAFAGASMASLVGIDLAFRFPDRVGALALWTGSYRSDGFARGISDSVGAVLGLDGGQAGFRAAAGAFLPALSGRAALAEMPAERMNPFLDMIAAQWFQSWRADELAARYHAVGHCDLAAVHGGRDHLAAGIACPLLLLQADSDQIFDMADARGFVDRTPAGRMEVIETPMGHIAPAAPPGSAEFSFFDQTTARFLAEVGR